MIDTGASLALTPVRSDFVGEIHSCNTRDLHEISSSTKVFGKGIVKWTVRDVFGIVHKIQTEAYYVPDASIRLFVHRNTTSKSRKLASTLAILSEQWPVNTCRWIDNGVSIQQREQSSIDASGCKQESSRTEFRGTECHVCSKREQYVHFMC